MKQLKNALIGLVLALVTCLVVVQLPLRQRMDFLTALLAATAVIYIGSALSDGRRGIIFLESVVGLAVFAMALGGLWYSSALLAIGHVAHGVWDFLHHPLRVGAQAGERFPSICLVYDWAVGVFILYPFLTPIVSAHR